MKLSSILPTYCNIYKPHNNIAALRTKKTNSIWTQHNQETTTLIPNKDSKNYNYFQISANSYSKIWKDHKSRCYGENYIVLETDV